MYSLVAISAIFLETERLQYCICGRSVSTLNVDRMPLQMPHCVSQSGLTALVLPGKVKFPKKKDSVQRHVRDWYSSDI